MKRRLRALAAVLAGLGLGFAITGGVHGATFNVGQHEHVAVLNAPAESSPVARAPYTFHLDIKLHDYPTPTKYLRIDRDGGTTTNTWPLVLGPAPGTTFDYPLDVTVDFSSWSVGRHEMRWHLEVPDTGAVNNHKRQFTTSRMQVCVVSCSPSYRSGPFLAGGSWYGGYMIPLIVSNRATTVVPGGTVSIKSQYSAATSLCAYLNPNFHAGDHGTILGCFGGGTATRTISLAGAVPGDNLVIIARDAQQAGVTHVKVGDSGPTFYFETQSWWLQAGLVMP